MIIPNKRHYNSFDNSAVTGGYVVASIALGIMVPRVNEGLFPWLVSPLSGSTITAILSAVSSGMIAFTGIVFSLAFVMIQMSSSAYSPRLVRLFSRDRTLFHSVGIFTGTFLYSLMALRAVGVQENAPVSAFTVWVAFAWLLLSIVALIRLVSYFTNMTIFRVLSSLSKAGRQSIAFVYGSTPHRIENSQLGNDSSNIGPITQTVVHSGAPAYFIALGRKELVTLAAAANGLIRIPHCIGDPIMHNEPLAFVHGGNAVIAEGRLRRAIVHEEERALLSDPKYVLRLLVDIAIRALSPAVNDPATAVQSLDQIESLLQRLGSLQLDIGCGRDTSGVMRLVYIAPTWEDYLMIGLSEIQHYGAESLEVERRLAALLQSLEKAVPDNRKDAVRRCSEERLDLIRRTFSDEKYRERAEMADRQGIGHGGDWSTVEPGR